jgi:hypothetical protein
MSTTPPSKLTTPKASGVETRTQTPSRGRPSDPLRAASRSGFTRCILTIGD